MKSSLVKLSGVFLMMCLCSISAEPPPPANRYLPPPGTSDYRTSVEDRFAPPPPPPPAGAAVRQTEAVFRARPSSNYGPPNGQTPSQQYGPPSRQTPRLSSEYGPPSQQQNPPSARQYLPPGEGAGGPYPGTQADENSEASYSFEYSVQDAAARLDFGHRESREGVAARGVYYVLLPDGRKQTVMYEADEGGYRPKISYELVGDTGAGAGAGEGGYSERRGGGGGGPY